MTWQLPSRNTVTGTCSPVSVKRRIIPIFCASTPERIVLLHALELDLDVDAGGEIELHQRIYCLRRRIDDIEQALMRAHFELFTALLVDMRRTVDREFFDLGRQRNGSPHLRAGALRGIDDL